MKELSNLTLLYAEDELSTLMLYEQYFANYFAQVYLAHDGEQAYELYKRYETDVVFLDINMPKLDGLTVGEKIRKLGLGAIIVLITARDDKETLMSAIDMGVTAYLEKPINRQKMKFVLKKICALVSDTKQNELWVSNDEYYWWDYSRRELLCNKQHIALTKNETSLFELLMNAHPKKINYQKIHNYVWQNDYLKEYSESSIKTLINGLRTKLPPKVLKNTYSEGYSLVL